MTRKDYRLIAAVLLGYGNSGHQVTAVAYSSLVTRFADALGEEYDNFDRARFMDACFSRSTMPRVPVS